MRTIMEDTWRMYSGVPVKNRFYPAFWYHNKDKNTLHRRKKNRLAQASRKANRRK